MGSSAATKSKEPNAMFEFRVRDDDTQVNFKKTVKKRSGCYQAREKGILELQMSKESINLQHRNVNVDMCLRSH